MPSYICYLWRLYFIQTNYNEIMLLFSYPTSASSSGNRSVRKDSTHAKRQTPQEEENEHQEMHTESLLQRVIYF